MLSLSGVTVRFGTTTAVDDVSLTVAETERLSVLGPSGSGKSTLLRAICGLEELAPGRITWDGRDLASVPVHRRGLGLMFQDYVLFPHLSIAQNVAFGLEMSGAARSEIEERVAHVLALVRLDGYGRRLPAQLSGGEQQRVALARALAPRPRLLMLDEPLGALDRNLRRSLLDELTEIFTRLKLPIIYVTHDHEEALAVGERVAVMRAGRIEALAPPRELWLRPPNEFVARFLGFANIVDVDVTSDGGGGRTAIASWGQFAVGDGVPVGRRRVLVRPDSFRPARGGHEAIGVTVESTVFRGDHTLLRTTADEIADGKREPGRAQTLEVQADWSPAPVTGERLRLAIEPGGVVDMPPSTGELP